MCKVYVNLSLIMSEILGLRGVRIKNQILQISKLNIYSLIHHPKNHDFLMKSQAPCNQSRKIYVCWIFIAPKYLWWSISLPWNNQTVCTRAALQPGTSTIRWLLSVDLNRIFRYPAPALHWPGKITFRRWRLFVAAIVSEKYYFWKYLRYLCKYSAALYLKYI